MIAFDGYRRITRWICSGGGGDCYGVGGSRGVVIATVTQVSVSLVSCSCPRFFFFFFSFFFVVFPWLPSRPINTRDDLS